MLCFIATVGLLLAYHNSPSPNLPHRVRAGHGIPKASLLLTIGTSIAQLKWIWFQQGSKRQLYNLQSFDDASRGPLGSLKILFQRPQQGRLLLSLAAVVTLLAFVWPLTRSCSRLSATRYGEVPSLTAKATTNQAMAHAACHSSLLHSAPMTMTFFNAMNAGRSRHLDGAVNTRMSRPQPVW